MKSAADTFRQNPGFDTETAIKELAIGEALVSLLDEKGQPGVVERAFIVPPGSQIGPISPEQRSQAIRESLLYGRYEKALDRESAYEILMKRAEEAARAAELAKAAQAEAKRQAQEEKEAERDRRSSSRREGLVSAFFKSAARSLGSAIGRSFSRGVLGTLTGSKSKWKW